jgi:hypothetical protein
MADSVVVGEVAGKEGDNLLFRVEQTFKGAGEKEIAIRGQRPINTEMNGFALPANHKVLLFLNTTNHGVYDNVEDYNSACNRLWLVNEGRVIFIEKDNFNEEISVAVEKLKEYLTSTPAKLVYKYK